MNIIQFFTTQGWQKLGAAPKAVQYLSDSTGTATITPNTDTYQYYELLETGIAGTITIANDTATTASLAKNKRSMMITAQTTNAMTLVFGTNYIGGLLPLPTTTTGGTKEDNYTFLWSKYYSKWEYTGIAPGF